MACLWVGVGLGLLAGGGALAERGATGLAAAIGMGDEVIGLTIVAIATSLPELATSIAAVRQNQVDIAVGNVVGSNIFNLALVLGVTTTVAPVPVPAGGLVAIGFMALLTFALMPVSLTRERHISRLEGAALLLAYGAFLAVQAAAVLRATGSGG
jgi:cation:H+ antiporter